MNKEYLLHFHISNIRQETPLAKTFELKLQNGKDLIFLPGQFLTFIIQTEKHELRRSYSILNLPGERLQITVKKVENGLISRFILQTWEIGTEVYSLPPAGRFHLNHQTYFQRDIFCFAAGSGIVPILPQIRFLLMNEPQSSIHLIYSNRNETDTLFLSQIDALAETYAQLNVVLLFSEPEKRMTQRGRLSNLSAEILIEKLFKFDRKEAVFLICGPFSYMRMLIFTIGRLNFDKEKIKRENFVPEIMRSGQSFHKTFPDTTIQIKTPHRSVNILVKSGESILDAGLNAGLNLPYSCKGGVCGNCAAKCTRGKVFMTINEVLSNTDLNEGWVLTCTGFPEDKSLIIDFNTR